MKVKQSIALTTLGLAVLLAAGALIVKMRGFRASSQPSYVESSVGRVVRNFSIPHAESIRTNTYAGDEMAIRQGREMYLVRCASCHGTDGRGTTPIGTNVYPRVPDLQDSPTQKLSDGDLHYIILHGVQLSGMPAMAGHGFESDRESWALVSYVRTMRLTTTIETHTQQAIASSAHYVGSQSCEACHKSIYDRWKKTPMANVVRDPRQHPEAILPDLRTNDVSKFQVDQVALVYGSIWKQRYFTKQGDDYYPLPAQWDIHNKKWLKYHVPDKGADWWTAFYPSDNMQRPTSATCDGCHSVHFDIHSKKPTEWNVGCERCHGPGSEHAAHPTRLNILNPSQMDSISANDTCIACHSQG